MLQPKQKVDLNAAGLSDSEQCTVTQTNHCSPQLNDQAMPENSSPVELSHVQNPVSYPACGIPGFLPQTNLQTEHDLADQSYEWLILL